MTRTFIWLGLFVGSTLGGFVPLLWGDDLFSMAGLLGSTIGGIAGIFGGYRLGLAIG